MDSVRSVCVCVCVWCRCVADSGDGNVTAAAPDDDDGARYLAVVVLVHGGDGYDVGSGNAYDASVLALVGRLVVITLNYRLGILGAYAQPASDVTESAITMRSPFCVYEKVDHSRLPSVGFRS